MRIPNTIRSIAADMTRWRQDIHAHPELGFEEYRTSSLIAEKLENWGIKVSRGLAGTGVVGTLRAGDSGRSIGLRADMDALPITETNALPYRSTREGVMHACGHDGHVTMLLGAAQALSRSLNFDGTVHFIFQPAEEGLGGGRKMVEDGLFREFPCDKVFALHVDGSVPINKFTAVSGPVCASSDEFTICVRGIGGHASRPHSTIDPVLAASHVVVALQSIVARRVDPLKSAVVTVTQLHAGTSMNAIPDCATIKGTVRTYDPSVRNKIEELLSSTAQAAASITGATTEVSYRRIYPTLVNAIGPTEDGARAAAYIVSTENVIRDYPPAMGAEDFSFMAQKVPACFLRIGQAEENNPSTGVLVHNSKFNFNDNILVTGASFWLSLVEQELNVAP